MKDGTENDITPIETYPSTFEDCGVSEEQFPHIGECCGKFNGPGGTYYKKTCPHCTVWISRPDPSSLEIAAIIECPKYGFGKRIRG